MVKLTFEDEFKLLSNELWRIFSSNLLDELAKTHKFKQQEIDPFNGKEGQEFLR